MRIILLGPLEYYRTRILKSKKFHWDLIRVLVVASGILGEILTYLRLQGIWNPINGVLSSDFFSFILVALLCGVVIVSWGILGWDIWEVRFPFLAFIGVGLILIFLFGNVAGVLLVISAISIPFGR